MAAWTLIARDLAAHFVVALVLATALTPAMERLALSVGAIDQPTERKRHRRPTPLLGGLAIQLAFWIAAFALVAATRTGFPSPGWVAAALLVAFVGLWDDLRRLPVWVRLVAQAASAIAVLASMGAADLPLDNRLDTLLTFLWIVGVTNALNLVDNMDGVASALTAAAAVSYAALLAAGGGLAAACLALALAGAAIGFLFFNFPPARLFMGDAGSFFLGLTLALLGLEVLRNSEHESSWIPAVLILAVPLFDTTLVTISRLRRGKNPLTKPGRDHLAHRLRRRGWSGRKIVIVFAASTLVLGATAWYAATSPIIAWVAGAVVLSIGIAMLVWLEWDRS